jgi:hypothetical protein
MATIHKALPLSRSGSLNFNVVGGTTEPTNPKENTIWVNTETKIGHWSLEPTEPTARFDNSSLQVGDVWVKTLNTNGIMSFNPLKKNDIDIHIAHTIYQWDGSKWARANGTIYGTNASVEFSIAETLGLSASGACGHAINNAVFNTYSNTFIIPEGYTKVTLNSMGINEWTYGETYGTVYLNGVSKGSKSAAYTGYGNNVGNNITIPQTWNVVEGDVIKVEIKGYTNANVSAVQNCSIWINFTLS